MIRSFKLKTISFKKLFEAALLPAAIMLLAKLAGFWLMVMSLNIPWTINFEAGTYPGIYPFITDSNLSRAASFVDTVFVWVMLIGLFYYVFTALFLHNSHVHPKVISRLVKYNMLHLIKDNFNLYHEIIVWLIFAWIANILVLLNSLEGKTIIGIPTFSILFTAFLTVVFFKDACNELENREEK